MFRYFESQLMSIFILMLIFGIIFVPLFFNDKIEIDLKVSRNFENEYNQCIQDLENTQPICPSCECSSSSFEIIYGFIFGLIAMFFFYDLYLFPRVMKWRLKKNSEKKGGKE